MKYQELKSVFRNYESDHPQEHLTAYITFSSFGKNSRTDYSLQERTYSFSSNNKAFQPNKGGYSIFGSCLDLKSDPCLRLEAVMADEHGGKDGWIVEDCCILAYLLTGVNEREILQPQMYYSEERAMEAMFLALCKESGLTMEELMDEFRQNNCEVVSDCYSVNSRSAWLNAPGTGNWDWKIHLVRIYSLTQITVGDVERKAGDSK